MSVRVLVVDDQELARAGVAMMLAAAEDLEVVAEAADGRAALAAAAEHRPDVVLMDARMPVMDGLEAAEHLLARPDSPRVVILTTFGHDEYVFRALRAGASGFVLKDAPRDRIVEAVRAAAAGEALISPSITRKLIERFAALPSAPAAGVPAPGLDELTPRELEVLELMGRGRSNREIAEQFVLSEKTVKTHVSRVLMKLGLRDRTQAVILAYESGIVVPGRADA